MMTADFVLILLAFICFVAAALQVSSPRVNLVAAGLACWVATLLF
jgi:hypothetical protein